jgi:hypothetical protein
MNLRVVGEKYAGFIVVQQAQNVYAMRGFSIAIKSIFLI